MIVLVRSVAAGLATLVLLSTARPAAAQGSVEAGYVFQRASSRGEASNLPVGAGAAYVHGLGGRLAIGGLFDWSREADSEDVFGITATATTTFAGAGGLLRYALTDGMTRQPYVQAAAGAVRVASRGEVGSQSIYDTAETKPFVSIGVGLTNPITSSLRLVGQFDYRLIMTDDKLHDLRVFVGVRLR